MLRLVVPGLFFLFFLANSVYAQSQRVNALVAEGNKYYEEEQYKIAIAYFQEANNLEETNSLLEYKLAECYRKTFNYTSAEAYYLKTYYNALDRFPLSLYYYALMLKLNGNYEEAITYFDEFINYHKEKKTWREYVDQAIVDKTGCEIALDESEGTPIQHKLLPDIFNTSSNDYAPAILDSNHIVITSGRISSNRALIDERFGEAFTDNYYLAKVDGKWQDKTKQFFSITNTRFNDGSGCFTSSGDKYYYTICGKDEPQCRIFLSKLQDGKWSEPMPLNSNVNFKSYEAKQPAISHGGDTLIFVSNRPGGYGKNDIWMCINSGDDEWGPAINLGQGVNTNLNEISPVLTPIKNIIFFSSEGHVAYGGFDIYMAKRLSGGDTLLYNLDSPFNSSSDDCFINFTSKEIYWSSNRADGRGGFDLYSAPMSSLLSFVSRISLKNRNDKRDVKLKSRTGTFDKLNLVASQQEERISYEDLTYERKRIVDQMVEERSYARTSTREKYENLTPEEFDLLHRISEQRFQEHVWQLKMSDTFLMQIHPVVSGVVNGVQVTGTLRDSLSHKVLQGVKVLLTDTLEVILKITETNEEGNFKFTDVKPNEKFFIRLEKKMTGNISPQILNLLIKEINDTDGSNTYAENIYFDFNNYVIRPEATRVLDALTAYLKEHSGLQVEIFSYADDRGSYLYNLRLTQKRGQAVVNYLTSKGVDATGLAIIPKGKQLLKGSGDALERQYNRRVEFYVNGNTENLIASCSTYILRKEISWSKLAELTGVTIAELTNLNDARDEVLKAYQPVRIPLYVQNLPLDYFFVKR